MGLNNHYQNSGDLVKVLQNASLFKPYVPHIINGSIYFDQTKMNDKLKYGVVVERFDTPLGILYQVLIEDEFWCVNADGISWLGV